MELASRLAIALLFPPPHSRFHLTLSFHPLSIFRACVAEKAQTEHLHSQLGCVPLCLVTGRRLRIISGQPRTALPSTLRSRTFCSIEDPRSHLHSRSLRPGRGQCTGPSSSRTPMKENVRPAAGLYRMLREKLCWHAHGTNVWMLTLLWGCELRCIRGMCNERVATSCSS